MKKAILFDLDGTLLPMPSQEAFVKVYFGLISRVYDVNPNIVIRTIWDGTKAMVSNDGSKTNEEVFWDIYASQLKDIIADDYETVKMHYEDFYQNEFNQVKETTYANPDARDLIEFLKAKDVKIILATNPIFPSCAVKTRLNWIDLKAEDFDFITTYENMGFCKPNPKYYQAILKQNGLLPEDVIMVGNDINEDILPCQKCGIDTILVEDTMIGDSASVDCEKTSFNKLKTLLSKYFD